MHRAHEVWTKLTHGLFTLRHPLLAAIRMYWGYQFALTGWGKLTHIDRVADWFGSLGIPAPELNAYMAGGTELIGGLLLLVGLGSRVASVPLIITMVVAYLTADFEALSQIFTNSDAFVTAAPFLFLLASVIVLVFGPGHFSLDHLVSRFARRQPASVAGSTPRAASVAA